MSSADTSLPDTVSGAVALRWTPVAWHPFVQLARADRPIGSWLLLLPCWWSIALAAVAQRAVPNVLLLAVFLVGAIAMRGAGSTYNDLADAEIDQQVERTRGRPLPSRRVTRRAAKIFMVAQALVGAIVLFSLNGFSIWLGLASLLIVAAYPFAKRVTSWPQAILGFAFAWGALMGWAAVFGRLDGPAVALYAAAILWTIGYDTIYALQDERDDAIAGVRSTARLFGRHVRLAVALFYAGALLCVGVAVLWAAGGPVAWIFVAAFGLHLGWQVAQIVPGDTPRALRLFRSNRDAGLLLSAGLLADAVLAAFRF